MNTRTRSANTGKGVELLEMKFGENKYDTQFTSTGKKKKYFIHDMHKLAVNVTLTQTTANKVINKHRQREVAAMYKEYTQKEKMKVMGAIDPGILTIS